MAEATIPLEIPVETGGGPPVASVADDAVINVIVNGMAAAAASDAANRNKRFDQLAADSASMWGIHMTTPTIYAGMGFRVAQQSAGYPANTGTGTGGEK
jgi:hypothetical protein